MIRITSARSWTCWRRYSTPGRWTSGASRSAILHEALRAAEDTEDAAEAAMDEPGGSVPWDQLKAELGI